MESGTLSTPESPQERRWDFFEDFEEDKPEDNKPEKKAKKKLFSTEQDPQSRQNIQPETDDLATKNKAEKKAKKSVVETEEFTRMTPEQQKQALAKEYVQNRSEELKEELVEAPEGSAEALEIAADLELIEALSEKLKHPEVIAEDAVEEAYQQIMARLDEILQEQDQENQELPELEPDEPEVDLTDHTEVEHTKPTRSKKSKADSKKSSKSTTKTTKSTVTSSGGMATSKNSKDSSRSTLSPEAEQTAPTEVLTDIKTPESNLSARRRRAGKLAVAEALNQMLATRYESIAPEVEPATLPNPEETTTKIERTIADKEEQVRKVATKQAVSSPIFESVDTKSSSKVEQPPVDIESLQPVSYQEASTRTATKVEVPVSREAKRDLQQASTEELLQIADRIKIDGTSLRSLFANNKIDRNGLTKVIKEAIKGGDVKSALKKATLGEEAQRGRAIEMRHDDKLFDDVKGYHQTSEAAQARTNRILEAINNAAQAKQAATPQQTSTTDSLDINQQAMQKAKAATQKARFAITTAIALATVGIVIALIIIL